MSYSFLRESKLYIEYSGTKYRIYTNAAISFSQTFAEDSYPVKTLHDQSKMFEGTQITTANPADFSFGIPLTAEKDESIVMDLLADLVSTTEAGTDRVQLKSFNAYIQTGSSTFKIENCVIRNATFNLSISGQFTVEIEGQGTKIVRVGDESYNLGTIQSESSTRTPLLIYPSITLDSLDMSSITEVTVQIQNDVNWTTYVDLHKSLSVTNSSNAMFPSAYTLGSRIVSGVIQQYQTNNNKTQFDDFSANSNLTITAKRASNNSDFWKIQLNPAMYTARLEVGEVYTQSYDFRSVDNTNSLSTQISVYS